MNYFIEKNRPLILSCLLLGTVLPIVWILSPFFLTLVLGLVFAVTLAPLVGWVEQQLKTRSNWPLSLVLASLLTILVIPFGLILIKGTQLFWVFLQNHTTPEAIERLKSYQLRMLEQLESLKELGLDPSSLQETGWSTVQKLGSLLTAQIGTVLSRIPETFLLFFVLILSVVAFLLMRRQAIDVIQATTLVSPQGKAKLMTAFQNCCRSVVVSTLVTGALQAGLTTVGAWLFTDHEGLLIFFITFLLSFVPIIGAGPVSLVMGVEALLDGRVGPGIGLMIFFALISVSDNVLRPWLLSSATRLPPIWGLLCTLGAFATIGLPGLFIGPLVGALTVEILPILFAEFER
jgi:predicted PurR-regulated permease PerM